MVIKRFGIKMPTYSKKKAELRAELLVKPLLRNGLNEAAVAREQGVSRQAINQRLKHKPVQDALRKFIESPELKRRLITVAQEALCAKKHTLRGVKPDHDARHKYWHDLVTAGGVLKSNGEGGVKIINIIHAYRKEKNDRNP